MSSLRSGAGPAMLGAVNAAKIAACVVMLIGCQRGGPTTTPPSSPEPARDAAPVAYTEEPSAVAPTPDAKKPTAARPPHTIYRSEIDRALGQGPGYLLRGLGPEPFKVQGRWVGWEITRVFPQDPELCAPGCDLAIGDIILSVNGDRLETPDAFMKMIEKLPKLEALKVRSLRGEKRRIVTYKLVEDRDATRR